MTARDELARLSRLRGVIVAALLLLHGWMALSESSRVGLTFDEPAHLTAGRSYWATGDYRLQPENGHLPQRWIGLPATWREEPFPSPADPGFLRGDVWSVARDYLFGPRVELTRLLLEARGMVVLLGLALAAAIYFWTREMFGERGALVALAAAVFCPHLLAHAGLATSDLAAALGFTLATWTWWRLLHRVTWPRVIAAGCAAGALALAKFSAVLFAPVAAALLLMRLLNPETLSVQWRSEASRDVRGAWRLLPLTAAGAAAVLLAAAVIWTAYGWRFAATPDPADAQRTFQLPWATVLMEEDSDALHRPGVVQAFVRTARDHRLLPEAYLYGLTYTDYFSRARAAYFAGEHRLTGWRSFFPAVFVLKTTPATLVLLGLAIAALAVAARRERAVLYRTAPLWVFAAVYWAFALTSSLNIGHRHLLPLYPLIYVAIGAVALPRVAPVRWSNAVLATLLLWQAVEAWRVRPHYLTYFNALAGGPAQAHRYFVDSSLDWGQGLPDLAQWLRANAAAEPVYLAYFGTDELRRFDLHATPLLGSLLDPEPAGDLPELGPGVYCLSATMYRGAYTDVRGPWTAAREVAYRTLRTRVPLDDAAERRAFAQLRFARLCRYLDQRAPDATVANSILVFRLDAAAIAEALGAGPTTPAAP